MYARPRQQPSILPVRMTVSLPCYTHRSFSPLKGFLFRPMAEATTQKTGLEPFPTTGLHCYPNHPSPPASFRCATPSASDLCPCIHYSSAKTQPWGVHLWPKVATTVCVGLSLWPVNHLKGDRPVWQWRASFHFSGPLRKQVLTGTAHLSRALRAFWDGGKYQLMS